MNTSHTNCAHILIHTDTLCSHHRHSPKLSKNLWCSQLSNQWIPNSRYQTMQDEYDIAEQKQQLWETTTAAGTVTAAAIEKCQQYPFTSSSLFANLCTINYYYDLTWCTATTISYRYNTLTLKGILEKVHAHTDVHK